MAYSEAQKEASARYNKKAYDQIEVIVPKGQRKIVKAFAASQGKSVNRFICEAIYRQMGLAIPLKHCTSKDSDGQEE